MTWDEIDKAVRWLVAAVKDLKIRVASWSDLEKSVDGLRADNERMRKSIAAVDAELASMRNAILETRDIVRNAQSRDGEGIRIDRQPVRKAQAARARLHGQKPRRKLG
jgi:hypothetical protein